MTPATGRVSAVELLDREFLEQRARLLEVAAFLDRLDRSTGSEEAKEDFRYRALILMLEMIASLRKQRVEELLLCLSDKSSEPAQDRVPPGKACGAWRELT